MKILDLTSENFEKNVFIKDKTVVVYFFASWCMPCKAFSQTYEKYDSMKRSDVILVRVDIDKSEDLCKTYNIYSVPTLMLVKDGNITKIEPGFKSIQALKKFVES